MSAMQRNKGAGYERELATYLNDHIPGCDARRGILQCRNGSEVPDVVMHGLPGFWLEAKRGKLPNPRAALKQAQEASEGQHCWPVAVVRDDRQPAFVVMSLSDWAELVGEWAEMRRF